jgi:hypothetical protein
MALVVAVLLTFANFALSHAGDPDDVIGGMNVEKFECLETENDEGEEKDPPEPVDISEDIQKIKDESRGNFDEDISKLADACDDKTNKGILVPIRKTKIEGKVFEFLPQNPSNPAAGGWYAIPAKGIPVIAKGVSFEIFWVSEENGFFYFYKTRFGEGPIVLNLRLPPNAHAINPNILIESTGEDEVWTVFLGFYRGDVAPAQVDQLETPNGNFLPFGDSSFDPQTGLPGVGGVLPQPTSQPVMALAAVFCLALPIVGVFALRKRRVEA